jgi:hypothetical protein
MRAPLLVLAGFAIAAALIAWSRWLSRRRWAAAGNLLLSVAAALVVAVAWPVARNLETYETVVHGQAIASLYVEKTGSSTQRVTLTRLPSGRMQVLELGGDEWRLVVQTLGWTPLPTSLGFRTKYRLESLDSRDSAATETAPKSVVMLTEARGFDLRARSAPGSLWSKLAVPGAYSTPWEPLGDKERFRISFEGEGLTVERRNEAAPALDAAGR